MRPASKKRGKTKKKVKVPPIKRIKGALSYCGRSLIECLTSLSLTYKIAADKDHVGASYIKIRDIVIYLYFMIMLFTITFGVYTWNAYHLTHALTTGFINQVFYCNLRGSDRMTTMNISSTEDIWCYLESLFCPTLAKQPFWGDKLTNNETWMLTVPRMRQVRVREEKCMLRAQHLVQCYEEFSEETESTDTFGQGNSPAWVYNPPEVMGDLWYKGIVSYYNSAGYYTSIRNWDQLQQYKDYNWIDVKTRALFIDFTVYNLNVNLYGVCQIVFELPPTGGVIPASSFNSLKFLRYVDDSDYRVLACELMLCVFSLYYTLELIFEMLHFKSRFLHKFHNWVDLLIISLCWGSIYTLYMRDCFVGDFMTHKNLPEYEFVDYQPLKRMQLISDRLNAMTLFCSYLKVYRYLHFDSIELLFTTLKFCSKDLASFAFLFIIIVFAYAQLGTLLFSHYLKGYKTVIDSAFTLLHVVMGEFDFHNVYSVYTFLGPLYIVSFILFVVFFLLNCFFAIINATFSVVSNNVKILRKTEYLPFLEHCWKVIRKKDKAPTENHKHLTNSDHVREMMKASGFSDLEIEMFFARYTIDHDHRVPADVFNKIVLQKVPPKYLVDLKKRIKVVEKSVNVVLEKANRFWERVEEMRALTQIKR